MSTLGAELITRRHLQDGYLGRDLALFRHPVRQIVVTRGPREVTVCGVCIGGYVVYEVTVGAGGGMRYIV